MFGSISSLSLSLSAAERPHACIKSDVYDCRFDFSTHLYLLSAAPHARQRLQCQISVSICLCLIWSICLLACWSMISALVSCPPRSSGTHCGRLCGQGSAGTAGAYCICPGRSPDPNLFGKFDCVLKERESVCMCVWVRERGTKREGGCSQACGLI